MPVYYVVWVKDSGETVTDPFAFLSSTEAIVTAFRIQALSRIICEFEVRKDELGQAGQGPIRLAA